MSLKKLTELAKKFQTKLAQSKWDGLTPEETSSMSQEELQYKLFGPSERNQRAKKDPIGGRTLEELGKMPQMEEQEALFGPSPNKAVQPTVPAKPMQPNSVALTKPGALPVDIKSKLDVGSPGLKGMIYVLPDSRDPKNLRIYYNTERWTRGNEAIKRILTNALPGYNVFEVVGHQNPTWTTNYY